MLIKEQSSIQEKLVKLFLRLNGFFSEGFIVHSNEYGRIKAEVDLIAVRFPYHSETERQIDDSPALKLQGLDRILVCICEVKSHGQKIKFNESLRNSPETLSKILKRTGCVTDVIIERYLIEIHALFNHANFVHDSYLRFDIPDTNISIASILFKPDTLSKNRTQKYFISWHDINSFICECFRPQEARDSCSTIYDYNAWGEYNDIVKFFKSERIQTNSTIDDLYQFIEESIKTV